MWYFGVFGSLGMLGALPQVLASGDYLGAAPRLVWLGLSIAYLALVPWSRRAMLLGTIALSAWNVAQAALGIGAKLTDEQLRVLGGPTGAIALTATTGLLSVLIAVASNQSPRNKLAFELPLSDAELAKVYDNHGSSPLARRAFWYGLLLAWFPRARAITLVIGVVALRRADPKAWPPRGGRGPAIVISSLSLCGRLAFIVSFALRVH